MGTLAGALDMIGLLERAALAGGQTTARATVHVEAAEMARERGFAVYTPQADLSVVVTVTEPGYAYLTDYYGEGWLDRVRREIGQC